MTHGRNNNRWQRRGLQYLHDKGGSSSGSNENDDFSSVGSVVAAETTTPTTSVAAVATTAVATATASSTVVASDEATTTSTVDTTSSSTTQATPTSSSATTLAEAIDSASTTTAAAAVEATDSSSSSSSSAAHDSDPGEATTTIATPSEEETNPGQHHLQPHEDAENTFSLLTNSEDEDKTAYESQFSWLPVTSQTGTTFSLFSDPDRFSINHIYNATHYLTNKLEGRLWLDVNGDGRRGDYTDATVNAMEYDTGIGGVKVQLVDCNTDMPLFSRTTLPIVFGVGGPIQAKISEDGSAGLFSFDINSVQSGRYYLVYEAPPGYRLSGNVLPLNRGPSPNFNCIPSGGEGTSFAREAMEMGDLDMGGYCGRSIGCMELGPGPYPPTENKKSSYLDPYSKIVVLEDEIVATGVRKDYTSYGGNLAAMPSAGYLDVGLAREKWPLPTYQYAEGQISLMLPSTSVPWFDVIEAAVPKDFERSLVRKDLEEVLTEFFGGTMMMGDEESESAFTLQGIHLHSGKIVDDVDANTSQSDDAGSRMLRSVVGMMSASRQLSKEDKNSSRHKKLEYTFTTRGSYRPPPFQQLGEIVQESINRDPEGLVKSLKKKESLPEVFNKVEDVEARHLTVKVSTAKKPQVTSFSNSEEGGLDSWAFISVILLASLIAALIGIFLYRRAFVRRVRTKGKDHHIGVREDLRKSMSIAMIQQELEAYGVSTDGFLEKGEMVDALLRAQTEGKKKRKTLPDHDSLSSSSSSSSSSLTITINHADAQAAADRQARIQLAMTSCETLKVSELKQMLESLGVSSQGFLEKREFVQALAEARVDGVGLSESKLNMAWFT